MQFTMYFLIYKPTRLNWVCRLKSVRNILHFFEGINIVTWARITMLNCPETEGTKVSTFVRAQLFCTMSAFAIVSVITLHSFSGRCMLDSTIYIFVTL